ncbi:MAG: hypothetical protein HOE75_11670 [Chloroflexi bacterium]|jgi:CheY-specific phosphatase CheX|nr:hypothetical protein [Chloroflexota bacterium]
MRHTGPEIRQITGYIPPTGDLVAGVFRLIQEYSSADGDGPGPVSAFHLATELRHDLGPIKRACEMLESHGVIIKDWAIQTHSSPRYKITSEGQWATQADAQAILDYTNKSLADIVAQSWGRHFGMPLGMSSLAIGAWEYADEDVTAFVCAAGQAEGSVAFSMSRDFLLKSLAHAGGHDYRDFELAVKKFFPALIGRIFKDVGREIAAAGFDVALSSGVTVVGRGAMLSNPRDVRYLTHLANQYGRLKFRLTMRDSVRLPVG